MKNSIPVAIGSAVLGFALGAVSATVSVSGNFAITVFNPLTVTWNPPSPIVPCNSAPGTVVGTATLAAGDGNPIVASPTGGAFVFTTDGSGQWPLTVGPAGIPTSDCPVPPTLVNVVTVPWSFTQP